MRRKSKGRSTTNEIKVEEVALAGRFQEIVEAHSYDKWVESLRLDVAEKLQAENAKAPEATDENAYEYVRSMFVLYMTCFGMHPLDPHAEITDLLGLLEDLAASEMSREAKQHLLVNDLIENGAQWLDVNSPLNVGAYVYPYWKDWTAYAREGSIRSLQESNKKYNSRHKIRQKSRKPNEYNK
jgi:hypothetical protein